MTMKNSVPGAKQCWGGGVRFVGGGGGATLKIRTTHCDSATCFTTVIIMLAPTATLTTTPIPTAAATCSINMDKGAAGGRVGWEGGVQDSGSTRRMPGASRHLSPTGFS